MAVGRGLAEDRAAQIERVDDGRGAQVEVLANELGQLVIGDDTVPLVSTMIETGWATPIA